MIDDFDDDPNEGAVDLKTLQLRDKYGDTGIDAGPCPVVPLGHRDGVYYFLSPSGEFRAIGARELRKLPLLGLFDGDATWLRNKFPAHDQDGVVKAGSWSPDRTAPYLMRACTTAGLFDTSTPIRGPGVWRSKADDLIVHAGDGLRVNGEWRTAGAMIDGAIYAATAPCARPADQPADRDAGQQLLNTLEKWQFKRDIDRELLVGYMGSAMLGGAPAWRPHIMIVGPRGTGKSWLADCVCAAMGGGARAANNVTEAGLRQSLTGEARTIVLDESDAEEHTALQIQRVVGLLRLMSSGEGARVVRGSAGGDSRTFIVSGSACLFAILPPVLRPQDRSRITVLCLEDLASGLEHIDAADKVKAAIEATGSASAGLRARAIAGWGRFRDTFRAYRAAFMSNGCGSRDADRIATLLAGRDLLLHDDVPEAPVIECEVERFWSLIADAVEQDEDGEGQQALVHLLTSPVDLWRDGERDTVAQIIMKACENKAGARTNNLVLGKIGLRIHLRETGGVVGLLVANRHVALDRIFRDTRWAAGGWVQALRYVPGAKAWGDPVRFAGVQQRATGIPHDLLPKEDNDGSSEGR